VRISQSRRWGIPSAGRVSLLLLAAAATSFSQQTGSQQIGASALQQMRELMLEKQSRTAAQRKLSSHLVYASRQFSKQAITPSLPTMPGLLDSVGVDAQGFVLVDIKATVTPALLNDITGLGGKIVQSYPAYDTIQARVPLTALERITTLFGVMHITHTQPPFTNGSQGLFLPARRSTTIHAQLAAALNRSGTGRPALPELFSLQRVLRAIGVNLFAVPPDGSGDIAHRANLARSTYGIDGTGVKIGVISDGVTSLANEQAAGRLPAVSVLAGQSGVPASPGPCPGLNCPDEGTAMLEIVYSLAPGAQLFFATSGNSPAQMATNIQGLRNAGCDIIVDDVAFFNEGVFQDGPIALTVTNVVNAGAFYFSSAGNSGSFDKGTSGTWEGDFVNSGTTIAGVGTVHSFSGSTSDALTASTAGPVTLKWSDPLGKSCNDYDLFVLDSTLATVLDASTNFQDFCGNGVPIDPYEQTAMKRNNGERIVVVLASGVTRALHLDTARGRLAIATSGTIYGHAAAVAAFGVAATDVHNANGGAFTGGAANPVETFSSDGLRRVFYTSTGAEITAGNLLFSTNGGTVRPKPDITAADGVPTGVPGFSPFYGTSAAAPHAAAIAALVKQAKPGITQAQMFTALTTTALDIEAAGYDRDSGYGIVNALAAVASVVTSTVNVTITSNTTGLSFTVSGTGCAAGNYVTPKTLGWTPASSCVVTFSSPQSGPPGVQYTFSNWSDGPASNPRTITAPSATTTYTANFQTGYQLTINSSAGGTVAPTTGSFYNAGTVVAISATPNAGFVFSSWTGAGSGSFTGSANPASVTMNGPITETATFSPVSGGSGLQFIPVTPCRIMDTRPQFGFTGSFGPPSLGASSTRVVPIPTGSCNIPATAKAYSLNITVVPLEPTLGYLTVYPTGQPQPNVSTLNSLNGAVASNAAIVPAGTNGSISILVTNATELIIDINGYFAPSTGSSLVFYPLPPCRVVDTRLPTGTFGGPFLAAGISRDFPIVGNVCGAPASARALSLNVTVVPRTASLGFLTTWPSGQPRPNVSTLNSLDGSVKANAAMVPAGTNGAVSFYASNDTELVVDIDGYFAPPSAGGLSFYTATPCRIADTRNATGPFGGPILSAAQSRTFPILQSACGLPATAQAYSLNITVVPAGTLGFLTVYPTGQALPTVSTLNSLNGLVLANAAIVPSGTSGSINVYVPNATHVVIDTNGYFAP
jgi:Divergent InlB B-repeat domain/Subtilase family